MNYQHRFYEIVNNLSYKPTLLLHSCCGPCSSYVIDKLKDYFLITILYYNPNIEPETEYLKRKKEQQRLISLLDYHIDFMDIDYDHESFAKNVSPYPFSEGSSRCQKCIFLRLEKTAEIAGKKTYDYFGTTLTVSPYKNSDIINNIGLELEEKYLVKYLVSDFKKEEGYKKSLELSKKYNLYRQNYCGCLFNKKNSD